MKLSFAALILGLAFTACKKNDGAKAVTGAAKEAISNATATAFKINTAKSQVIWVGSKPGGQHTGTIGISGGSLGVNGTALSTGKITFDMNSIAVTDLKPGEGKEDLEAHLKGTAAGKEDHFFNVAAHPTASFEITNVGPATTGDQDNNATITGNLTLKGNTKSVTFPAFVGVAGGTLQAAASFKINRTEWGINFQSKSVFDDLKDKFINDEIALTLDISASK